MRVSLLLLASSISLRALPLSCLVGNSFCCCYLLGSKLIIADIPPL